METHVIYEVVGLKVELSLLQLELPRGVLPLVKQQLRLLFRRLADVHSLLERGESEGGEPLRLRPLHVRLRKAYLQPRPLRLLGGNSTETFQLQFWVEKWLDIPN